MAADINVLSTSITNLDAINPTVLNSSGQGASGTMTQVDDWAVATAAGMGTVGSYYRIVRFPTTAKIKTVEFATDAIADTSATASLHFDFNVAFSDSTIDGTPASNQALIPQVANTGTLTSFATYSTPNKMFGAGVVQPSANARWALTNYTFQNISTATYDLLQLVGQPLWESFGFVAAAGQPQDPGGNFDLTAYVATAAGTGGACKLYMRCSYVR